MAAVSPHEGLESTPAIADAQLDPRKLRERDYHDRLRGELLPSGDPKYTSYRKWYEAGYKAEDWLCGLLRAHAPGRRVLDFGCGVGNFAIRAAEAGGSVVAIDISETSIEIAQAKAREAGVRVDWRVMDAENAALPGASFDLIVVAGVLHHLDVHAAYTQLGRLLADGGRVVALEALGHNALINLYRRRTRYRRSPDERPLLMDDVRLARRYFAEVDLRFFNLATLLAGPLWKTPLLRPVVSVLSLVDDLLLRIPVIQPQAWMVGMVLRSPRRRPSSDPLESSLV